MITENNKLKVLLYVLLRDHITLGVMERILAEHVSKVYYTDDVQLRLV
jgi:hypothetical protein